MHSAGKIITVHTLKRR